jgi:hypothetical protein
MAASWLLVAALLVTVAQYYHPEHGFTRFIVFPAAAHASELAAVRESPHHDDDSGGYDGQFYAQLAIDPLLRHPSIDGALDLPPYRARRILMSWIAYAAGLGRPAWILQAYSLINVAAWLLLAWVLTRFIPPTTARGFVLWAASLTSHGMLSSIRLALPDGLSALLIAAAVLAIARDRALLGAAILGAAGLARETNLLASLSFGRLLRGNVRSILLVGACLVLCAIPLLLWLDYLRSIYRSTMLIHDGHITTPLWGIGWKLRAIALDARAGLAAPELTASIFAVIAWATRTGWTIRLLAGPDRRAPWTMVALAYVVLSLLMHPVVWDGSPGAFTRVLLPLALATNVTMAARPGVRWPLIVAANLDVIPGVTLIW